MDFHIRAGTRRDHDAFWRATMETVWADIPPDERRGLDRGELEKHFRPHAEAVLTSASNAFLVAETERGEFLGYAIVGSAKSMLSPAPFGFLYDLWVRPETRRQGVARALLGHAEKWCRAQGLRRLKLEVAASNAAAQALYGSAGFAEERAFFGKTL